MPFCANCGAEAQGAFCPSCGKPVGGASGPAPGPAPAAAAAGMQENMASALCYLLGLITGVLFLVLEPYSRNRNVRFHAFQSIFLNVAVVAFAIALGILSMVPVLGWLIAAGSILIWLGVFVLWIILLIKTYGGAKIVLPVIGAMAEKQAG